jgi:hypothetical protein
MPSFAAISLIGFIFAACAISMSERTLIPLVTVLSGAALS